jgi:hypothetical protein
MTKQNFHLHDGKKGSALGIRVTPRARRNEVVEIRSDGTVRIRLKAAVVGESANPILIEYLSEILEVPSTHIDVVAGQTGADKLVSILDLDSDAVHQRIIGHLSAD